MEKHLLELWLRLYLLKTYHARTNDDEPTQWVQWQDVEQTIHDFIMEHKLKQTGHVLNRRSKFIGEPNALLQDIIDDLRQRLQTAEDQVYSDPTPVRTHL